MYCMNCGVKLGDSEEKCPLCGLRAYHPEIDRKISEPMYPQGWKPPIPEKSAWRVLLTAMFIFAAALCFFIDIKRNSTIIWSGYAAAGIFGAYILVILPMWFNRINPVIVIPVDTAALTLVALYTDLALGGKWFLSFAFPVAGMYAVIFTAIAALSRHAHLSRFILLAGANLSIAASLILVEFLLSITFSLPMFVWCLYPTGVLTVFGLFWASAGIIRPWGDFLKKKLFL